VSAGVAALLGVLGAIVSAVLAALAWSKAEKVGRRKTLSEIEHASRRRQDIADVEQAELRALEHTLLEDERKRYAEEKEAYRTRHDGPWRSRARKLIRRRKP